MKTTLVAIALVLIIGTALAQTKTRQADTSNSNAFITDEGGIEILPSFPGGQRQFYRYLEKNIRYPPNAVKNHIQGKVHLNFIVEKNGSIDDVNVIKGVSKEIDAEAIRVLQNSPKWSPATRGGRPIRIQYSIPVRFELPKAKK